MALDIVIKIAEVVGNVIFDLFDRKRHGASPITSLLVAGLVLLLGGMSALGALAVVPQWHPIAIGLAVFFGATALLLGALLVGSKFGFALTPLRFVVLATLAAVGSMGALYVVRAF